MKALLCTTAICLLVSPLTAAETGQRVWAFDSDPAGQIARGFTAAVGDWKVVETKGGQALAQTAANADPVFNIALVDDTMARNVDISVKLLPIAGKLDQGGGIVWRAKDAKNYYLARYNPLEDNYRVYKVVEGKRTMFKSIDIKHTPGSHALRVTMNGDHIECYYDGRKVLEQDDATFSAVGKIGLWTKADAQSQFDDLTLIER